MAFDDVKFPPAISRGATGGPERRTEIVTLASGHEERNSRWADSRRRYNAGFGVKTLNDLHEVLAFFEERRGRLHGFRWKDHGDFKSCPPLNQISALDQPIGTGDGLALSFQLAKHYGSGLRDFVRVITKPVSGSVLVAVDGIVNASASINFLTGIVTFPTAPAPGVAITAGFAFDVPVRFDTDQIKVNITSFNAGDIPDIPIVELRA